MKTRSELKSDQKNFSRVTGSNLAQYHSDCRVNHQHVADRIMRLFDCIVC